MDAFFTGRPVITVRKNAFAFSGRAFLWGYALLLAFVSRSPALGIDFNITIPDYTRTSFQTSFYSDIPVTVRVTGDGALAPYGSLGGKVAIATYTLTDGVVGTYTVVKSYYVKGRPDDPNYSPFPFLFPLPSKWRYDHSHRSIILTASDGSPVYMSAFDPGLESVKYDYLNVFANKSNAHLPNSEYRLWSSPADGAAANSNFRKYNPSDFSFALNFTAPISAYPFYPSGFNGQADAPDDPATGIPRSLGKITYGLDQKYFGVVYWFPGKGDADPFNKPLVVGDAFDPFNGRDAAQIYNSPQYNKLVRMPGSSPRNSGYDLFFIDFSQGGGDIHINAMIELKLVEWLRSKNAAKAIIGGPSMSGIVARLACLYSLPANNTANADLGANLKGYLSIDSPQKGASISGNFQRAVYNVKNNDFVQFEVWLAGADDPADKWKMLNVPAAHQMLFEHYYPGGSARGVTDTHDSFYGFLDQLGGYRPGMPKVAIAYSNFYQPYPGFSAQPNVLYTTGDITPPQATQTDFGGQNWEFAPGSTGFWYRSSYGGQNAGFVTLKLMGAPDPLPPEAYLPPPTWEIYQGTFIPIESALDLRGYPFASAPGNPSPAYVAGFSPFDRVFYMGNPYNGYCGPNGPCKQTDQCSASNGCKQDINQKRYEHIVFDEQLLAAINSGLSEIEGLVRKKNGGLAAILGLILD